MVSRSEHYGLLCRLFIKDINEEWVVPKHSDTYLSSTSAKYLTDIILFKRETKLNLLVPLTIYISYGFNLRYWKIPVKLQAGYNITRITPDNIFFCREIMQNIARSTFSCVVYPNSGNLLHLLETNNLIMYGLLLNKEIIAVYFFRNSCTTVNNDKIVDCIGSIYSGKNKNIFILGFHHCLFYLRKSGFTFINIENISNNDCIIENILTKFTPMSVSNTHIIL